MESYLFTCKTKSRCLTIKRSTGAHDYVQTVAYVQAPEGTIIGFVTRIGESPIQEAARAGS